MFIVSFALLTGYPITGALLRPQKYLWSHAIIFGGVCFSLLLDIQTTDIAIKGGGPCRGRLSYIGTFFGQ